MKAFISCSGDESVGIFGCSTEVEIGYGADILDADDMRSSVRSLLRECFSQIWDDPTVMVEFEDDPLIEFSYSEMAVVRPGQV